MQAGMPKITLYCSDVERLIKLAAEVERLRRELVDSERIASKQEEMIRFYREQWVRTTAVSEVERLRIRLQGVENAKNVYFAEVERLRGAEFEIERLRSRIQFAPHSYGCPATGEVVSMVPGYYVHKLNRTTIDDEKCTCWKKVND
jgi:hypothetical protein